MARIVIHPSVEADWCSYFLEGLLRLYGYRSMRYRTEGFPEVEDRSHVAESGYLHFRLDDGNRSLRVVIDPMDTPDYLMPSLEWCDIYGKVNVDPQKLPHEHAGKIVSCAPHFPIRAYGFTRAMLNALRTYRRHLRSPIGHFKKHVYRPFRYQRPVAVYKPGEARHDYVFMTCSLWKADHDTNALRAMFMKAVKSIPRLRFEGGFIDRQDVDDYQDLRTPRRIGPDEYRQKLKASVVAFTNPAVRGAHSFRLGEYLALGKAILMPGLVRQVARPLVHGEHVHFVEPTYDSIRSGIERIAFDEAYRRALERGARSYFETVCNPTTLMRNLLASKHHRRHGAAAHDA